MHEHFKEKQNDTEDKINMDGHLKSNDKTKDVDEKPEDGDNEDWGKTPNIGGHFKENQNDTEGKRNLGDCLENHLKRMQKNGTSLG